MSQCVQLKFWWGRYRFALSHEWGGAKKREEERKYNMIFQLGPAKLNHNIDAHQMNSQRCFLACLVSAKNPHS